MWMKFWTKLMIFYGRKMTFWQHGFSVPTHALFFAFSCAGGFCQVTVAVDQLCYRSSERTSRCTAKKRCPLHHQVVMPTVGRRVGLVWKPVLWSASVSELPPVHYLAAFQHYGQFFKR